MSELAAELLSLCKESKLTLGSVESLTGGLFGASICSIPGASAVYMGGLITYDPKEKTALANVDAELIKKEGVVSSSVALAMAKGGAKRLNVDLCVSITGNAGPTVCDSRAPVGRAYLAISRQGKLYFRQLDLQGERNCIRQQCVEKMIESLLEVIKMPKEDGNDPKELLH